MRPILALVVGLVVGLTALELGLRLVEPARRVSDVGAEGGIYAPHPFMGYSLRPFAGSQGTNVFGLRAARVAWVKAPGTWRILCLGGSTTFGSGLTPAQAYPARLAELLAADKGSASERTYEVINCGVPGYTTAESLIAFALRLVDLDPDAILVYHGVNDARLIQARGFLSDYSHMRRSWTARALWGPELWLVEHSAAYRRIARWLQLPLPPSRLEHVLFVDDYRERFLSPREHAVNSAGVAAFGRNLAHIVALARGRDIDVALMTFAFCPSKIVPDKRQELGPTIAALNAEIESLAEQRRVPLLRLDALARRPELFLDFVHLTEQGARDQAALIMRQARAQGLWGLGPP